jgi:hypothetical protein
MGDAEMLDGAVRKLIGHTSCVSVTDCRAGIIQRVAAWAHYATVCTLVGWGLLFVTAPWHSAADDSHRGMMAVASGICLILLGLLALGVGALIRRRSGANFIGSASISILVLATAFFLAL